MYDLGGRGFSCKLVCPKVLCRGRSRLTYGKLGMKEWILLVAPVWVQGLGFGVERAMDPYSSPYTYNHIIHGGRFHVPFHSSANQR